MSGAIEMDEDRELPAFCPLGFRISKREKYLQLCDAVDVEKIDSTSTIMDEEDDVVRSLRTSPVHPINKDHASIDDFEILKTISRGAFGHVFLAKKKTTGDHFAIKVLNKADKIWKNDVESILAEHDILISVQNPFVIIYALPLSHSVRVTIEESFVKFFHLALSCFSIKQIITKLEEL